jgi:hypothetical protein
MEKYSTINYDYESLYPTTMKRFNDDLIKLQLRRVKMKKILENINNKINE